MKKDKCVKPHKEQDISSLPFYDINSTVSSTECTGIAPSAICEPHEVEAVSSLYDIHTPRTPKEEETQNHAASAPKKKSASFCASSGAKYTGK